MGAVHKLRHLWIFCDFDDQPGAEMETNRTGDQLTLNDCWISQIYSIVWSDLWTRPIRKCCYHSD